jgi:hypothetical protein
MFSGNIAENGAKGQRDQWYRELERDAAKVRHMSPVGAAHQRRRPLQTIPSLGVLQRLQSHIAVHDALCLRHATTTDRRESKPLRVHLSRREVDFGRRRRHALRQIITSNVLVAAIRTCRIAGRAHVQVLHGSQGIRH